MDQDVERRLRTDIPHSARVYDYLLGGKSNYAADRAAAAALLSATPDALLVARSNRSFMGRAIHHLAADAGVRQFLDIGTGLPTANNTHEVAQAAAPDSRIVYVDNDPLVLVHAQALLTSAPEGATHYVEADLKDPETVLREAATLLDLDQPVALSLCLVLQYVTGDEVTDIVGTLKDRLAPGSHLVISHPTNELMENSGEGLRTFGQAAQVGVCVRTRAEVGALFAGWELIEPGIVPASQWRPAEGTAEPVVGTWAGVARKP